MSRLIVASNRVVDLEKSVQSGGLAIALGDALHEGRSVWFGWDGHDRRQTTVRPPDCVSRSRTTCAPPRYPSPGAIMPSNYLGFSSKVLWPAFTNRLDLTSFDPAFLEGYGGSIARWRRCCRR